LTTVKTGNVEICVSPVIQFFCATVDHVITRRIKVCVVQELVK